LQQNGLLHILATLTHIITENSLSKVISERKEPCFVLNFFSGEVMSQFSIWAKLCAEKTLFAHPFKLKVLAVLYVRNGEVMVIPTTPPRALAEVIDR
jgi:hypothetical protein